MLIIVLCWDFVYNWHVEMLHCDVKILLMITMLRWCVKLLCWDVVYSCYVEIVAIFLNCMYVVPMMLWICLLHVLVSMLQVTCTTHKSHRKDHHSTSHVKAVEKKHLNLNSVLALVLPCILFRLFSKVENCDIYPRIWKHLCTPNLVKLAVPQTF